MQRTNETVVDGDGGGKDRYDVVVGVNVVVVVVVVLEEVPIDLLVSSPVRCHKFFLLR